MGDRKGSREEQKGNLKLQSDQRCVLASSTGEASAEIQWDSKIVGHN